MTRATVWRLTIFQGYKHTHTHLALDAGGADDLPAAQLPQREQLQSRLLDDLEHSLGPRHDADTSGGVRGACRCQQRR
jgi:hypothetical protein